MFFIIAFLLEVHNNEAFGTFQPSDALYFACPFVNSYVETEIKQAVVHNSKL
jgi:hypothetical protein